MKIRRILSLVLALVLCGAMALGGGGRPPVRAGRRQRPHRRAGGAG